MKKKLFGQNIIPDCSYCENAVIEKEGRRIIEKIPKGSIVIPLCIEGKELSSPELSEEIEKISLDYSSIAFIIGGSFGLSDEVKSLGKIKLSFGKITLPHQLARLVLLEQIYRAFSISNNSKTRPNATNKFCIFVKVFPSVLTGL